MKGQRNPVAKFGRQLNKGGPHRDRKKATRTVRGSDTRSLVMSDPDTMNVQELMDYVGGFGYSTQQLSNEEIYELACELYDGHEEGEPDELEF